jgi:hypothetical protein
MFTILYISETKLIMKYIKQFESFSDFELSEILGDVIYPTEKGVLDAMKKNNIKTATMYITAYVDHSGYQTYGYSAKNVNSDYYFKQKSINSKTKTFTLSDDEGRNW